MGKHVSVVRRGEYRSDSGFSLVELLVVVAILAILAAIAIPLFLNQRGKARMGVLKSDMRNVAMGAETAREPNGTFLNSSTVRDSVLDTMGKTTSPVYILVWPNCAQNSDGTAPEVSAGDYVVHGYYQVSPGVGSWAPGTTGSTFESKTGKWESVAGGGLYNQLWQASNPCRSTNGGSGYALFQYNSNNNFLSSVA